MKNTPLDIRKKRKIHSNSTIQKDEIDLTMLLCVKKVVRKIYKKLVTKIGNVN